jgi:hypothetical protein
MIILSVAESAYVRRFCWEVASSFNQFGSGSIFDYCRDHCQDLEILATVTDIQHDVLEEVHSGRAAAPEVPFPWGSFEELHRRADELQLVQS